MKTTEWPLYYAERLKVGSLESPTAVLTLWTPVDQIVKDLDPQSYSVAGPLYSPQGLSFLFRNLLANPKIRYLVVCGQDHGGAGKLLKDFFAGDGATLPDLGLPKEVLSLLREKVKLVYLIGETDGLKVAEILAKRPTQPPWGEPQIYPLPSPKVKTFPEDLSLFEIRRDFIAEAWLDVLHTVLRFGVKVERIGGRPVRAVLNLAVAVAKEDPEWPCLPPFLTFTAQDLQSYLSSFWQTEVHGSSYTYGERLRNYHHVDQVAIIKAKLRSFPSHEGAVAVLWDVGKDNFPPDAAAVNRIGKSEGWNVPCLNLLQAIVLPKKLHLTAYFRANDLYGAWPQNAFALRHLQGELARAVKVELGTLTTISHLAWLDENLVGEAEKVVRENRKIRPGIKPDPRGNFVVEVEKDFIKVAHYSPAGELLARYEADGRQPKAAEKLYREIAANVPPSCIGHALDLGVQLGRAEDAVKLGLPFVQDQPLTPK